MTTDMTTADCNHCNLSGLAFNTISCHIFLVSRLMAPPAQLNPILPPRSRWWGTRRPPQTRPVNGGLHPTLLQVKHFPTMPATHCSNCHALLQSPFLHFLSWFLTSILLQKVSYTQFSHYLKKAKLKRSFFKAIRSFLSITGNTNIHSLLNLLAMYIDTGELVIHRRP